MNPDMKIVNKPIAELKEYENNPRKNEAAVDAVANSIREFGFKVPIIIDKENVIVCGHTRLHAARKLGYDSVPCIIASDLTDEQIKAFRLADNKTAELADWDLDKLTQELQFIDNIDMEQFGFDDLKILEDDIKDDDFDEDELISENPYSKRGDIFVLKNHRVMCGDSTKQEEVDLLMNKEKARMVFTDPPWNVNYGAVEKDNAQGYKPRAILNDFMGTEDFKQFMFNAYKCMNSVSEDGCMTYVVMSAQEWGNCMLTLAQNDYHWSSTIIWNKDRLVLSRKDYHTKYEPIWYGWKAGSRLCPLDDRQQSDVWDFERPRKSDEHPTMKPVPLVARAVTNSSKKGDLILDLFGGSGTTLIAADQCGRRCNMMELDPKYVDVIVKRYLRQTKDFEGCYLIRDGIEIPVDTIDDYKNCIEQ